MFYDEFVKRCNAIGKAPSLVAQEIGINKSTVTHWSNGSEPTKANRERVDAYFASKENGEAVLTDKQLQAAFFGGEGLSREQQEAMWAKVKEYKEMLILKEKMEKNDT